MADLLILPTTSKQGYYNLLVVVDLATDECDFEPQKSKTSDETLKSLKYIFKRKHLNKPYASLKTDEGSEFKGVCHKYLYDESILHKKSIVDRHKSMASVENLNRTLGRLIISYLNAKEIETKINI